MIDRVKDFKWVRPEFYPGGEEQRQKHIREIAENRAVCSCDVCCNPRRNRWLSEKEKLTIQERRAKEEVDT